MKLREELFPEEEIRRGVFEKSAEEELRDFIEGDKVFRIAPRGKGKSARLIEQNLNDIDNIEEIHRANSPRRR